jgi:hypothetical protein
MACFGFGSDFDPILAPDSIGSTRRFPIATVLDHLPTVAIATVPADTWPDRSSWLRS